MADIEYQKMLEKVIKFTAERMGNPHEHLSEHTKIEDDFGIAGLDTLTFYDDFFHEFNIENPGDFNVDKYMTSEVPQFGLALKSIFSKAARDKLKVHTVTLGHLAKVAGHKRWVEET